MTEKALNRRAEPSLPHYLARLDVERLEISVDIADKRQAARGGQHGRHERRALLMIPELFHRPHVKRRESSQVPIASRHLEIPGIPADRAAAFDEFDLAAGQLEATLSQRDDERARLRTIGARVPVVSTLVARTRRNPVADFRLENIRPVGQLARLLVD